MPPTNADRTCRIRLDLTPNERDKFRLAAAKYGKMMSEFARFLVLKAIEESQQANGKKKA